MELTPVLLQNKEVFEKLARTTIKREGCEELLAWLETTDFYSAPSSASHHGMNEGDLVVHSVNVYKKLKLLELSDLPENPNKLKIIERMESIAICSLFHDLCKANFYTAMYKQAKTYCDDGDKSDAKGRFKWETVKGWGFDDKFPYGHGEKSVYRINKFMELTDEEALAIRWHMGGWDQSNKVGYSPMGNAVEFGTLITHLQVADMLSANITEQNNIKLFDFIAEDEVAEAVESMTL